MTYIARAVRLPHPPGNGTVTSGNSPMMHVPFPSVHQTELNYTVWWKCGLMLIFFSQQPTGSFQQDFFIHETWKFLWLCSLWGQICSKASLQLNLQGYIVALMEVVFLLNNVIFGVFCKFVFIHWGIYNFQKVTILKLKSLKQYLSGAHVRHDCIL